MRTPIRRSALAMLILLGASACFADGAPLMCQLHIDRATGPFLPIEVTFSALIAEGTPPYTVQWNFGDGVTGSGLSVQHTYTEIGVRTVVMTVSEASPVMQMCADSTVLYPGLAVDPACIATPTTRWGPAPLMVNFQAGAVFPAPGPLEWIWSFGDGTTSTQWAPLHYFRTPGTYWVALQMKNPPFVTDCDPVIRVTALPQVSLGLPASASNALSLRSPRPNPFDHETSLAFELPRAGHVRLAIVDLAGRTLATLVDGEGNPGPQSVPWRGRTDSGSTVAAGLYFARLNFAGETRSVTVVRLPG